MHPLYSARDVWHISDRSIATSVTAYPLCFTRSNIPGPIQTVDIFESAERASREYCLSLGTVDTILRLREWLQRTASTEPGLSLPIEGDSPVNEHRPSVYHSVSRTGPPIPCSSEFDSRHTSAYEPMVAVFPIRATGLSLRGLTDERRLASGGFGREPRGRGRGEHRWRALRREDGGHQHARRPRRRARPDALPDDSVDSAPRLARDVATRRDSAKPQCYGRSAAIGHGLGPLTAIQ